MSNLQKPKFAVIGGDMRMNAVAKSLKNDGYDVDSFATSCDTCDTLTKAIQDSDYIILPIPITKDGINIFSPFYNTNIPISELLCNAKDKRIFAGIVPKNKEYSNFIEDYYTSESLQILNASPTAEAAIEIAIRNTDYTLQGSTCLISGFGRIGKLLACKLKSLGANIIISARKDTDLAWAQVLNYTPVHTSLLSAVVKNAQIFFNTVPSIIYTTEILSLIKKDSIIIDLASSPGGVDTISAMKKNINVIKAPGLPGKISPVTAGKYIEQTILNLLK